MSGCEAMSEQKFSHPVVIKAGILSQEIEEGKEEPIEEHEGLFNWLNHSNSYEGEVLTSDINEELDELANGMGVCAAEGFKQHDKGNFQKAATHFFAKDVNMFGDLVTRGLITEEDILEASRAYTECLRIKDCYELANLPSFMREEVASRTEQAVEKATGEHGERFGEGLDSYRGLSTKEIYEIISQEEREALGIREVNSRDFWNENRGEEHWDSFLEDEDGIKLLEEKCNDRANALGLEEDLYSETWFILHKAVENYLKDCYKSRYSELAGATQLEEFNNRARALKSDNKREKMKLNPKPSDGLAGPGSIGMNYGISVEGHDYHSPLAVLKMANSVAPFYKASLLSIFEDHVEYNHIAVEDFGHTWKDEEMFEKWQDYYSRKETQLKE